VELWQSTEKARVLCEGQIFGDTSIFESAEEQAIKKLIRRTPLSGAAIEPAPKPKRLIRAR
jgi:hypothetical protein